MKTEEEFLEECAADIARECGDEVVDEGHRLMAELVMMSAVLDKAEC